VAWIDQAVTRPHSRPASRRSNRVILFCSSSRPQAVRSSAYARRANVSGRPASFNQRCGVRRWHSGPRARTTLASAGGRATGARPAPPQYDDAGGVTRTPGGDVRSVKWRDSRRTGRPVAADYPGLHEPLQHFEQGGIPMAVRHGWMCSSNHAGRVARFRAWTRMVEGELKTTK